MLTLLIVCLLFSSCLDDSRNSINIKHPKKYGYDRVWQIDISALEARLGYRFKDRQIIDDVLNNLDERKDAILGDKILDYEILKFLRKHPQNLSVKEIHDLRVSKANNKYLEKIAREKLKIKEPDILVTSSRNKRDEITHSYGDLIESIIRAVEEDNTDKEGNTDNLAISKFVLRLLALEEDPFPNCSNYYDLVIKFLVIEFKKDYLQNKFEREVISDIKKKMPEYSYIFDFFIKEIKKEKQKKVASPFTDVQERMNIKKDSKEKRIEKESPFFILWKEFMIFRFNYHLKIEGRVVTFFKGKNEEGTPSIRLITPLFSNSPEEDGKIEPNFSCFIRLIEIQIEVNKIKNYEDGLIESLEKKSLNDFYLKSITANRGINYFVQNYIFSQNKDYCMLYNFKLCKSCLYSYCSNKYKGCSSGCINNIFSYWSKICPGFYYLKYTFKGSWKMLNLYLKHRHSMAVYLKKEDTPEENNLDQFLIARHIKIPDLIMDPEAFHKIKGITFFEHENSFFRRVIKYQKMLEEFEVNLRVENKYELLSNTSSKTKEKMLEKTKELISLEKKEIVKAAKKDPYWLKRFEWKEKIVNGGLKFCISNEIQIFENTRAKSELLNILKSHFKQGSEHFTKIIMPSPLRIDNSDPKFKEIFSHIGVDPVLSYHQGYILVKDRRSSSKHERINSLVALNPFVAILASRDYRDLQIRKDENGVEFVNTHIHGKNAYFVFAPPVSCCPKNVDFFIKCGNCSQSCEKLLFKNITNKYPSFYYLNSLFKKNIWMFKSFLKLRYNIGLYLTRNEATIVALYSEPLGYEIQPHSFHKIDNITFFENRKDFFERVIKYQKMLEEFEFSLRIKNENGELSNEAKEKVIEKAKEIIFLEKKEVEEKARKDCGWIEMAKLRDFFITAKGLQLTMESEIKSIEYKEKAKLESLKYLKKRFKDKSPLFAEIILPSTENIKKEDISYLKFKLIFSHIGIDIALTYSNNCFYLEEKRLKISLV